MDFLATPHLWVLYNTPKTYVKSPALGRILLKSSTWQGVFLWGAIASLLFSPEAQARNFPPAGRAYVSPPPGYRVNLRNGPGLQHAVVTTLNRGTAVSLTGRYENGWAQLQSRWWIAGNLVNSAPPTGPRPAAAFISPPTGYSVNIRQGPGTQHAVVTTLRRGAQVNLTGRSNNGWAQLASGAWVAENLIQREQPTPTPNSPPTPAQTLGLLRRGSQGAEVTRLQNRLKALGYFPAGETSTGFFGDITEEAVRTFQQRNALVVDGIAGSQTLGVAYSGNPVRNNPAPAAQSTPAPQAAAPRQPNASGNATRTPQNDPVQASAAPDPSPAPASNPTPPANAGTPNASAAASSSTVQEVQIVVEDGNQALVFSGPGTENELMGFIPSGSTVRITGNFEGNWAELEDGTWTYRDWVVQSGAN